MNRLTFSLLAAAGHAGGAFYFGTRQFPPAAPASIPAAAVAAAGDWLNTLPRTALRDHAVSVYCERNPQTTVA